MNIKKALQNPFVLGAQGFVAGAALFFATTPDLDKPVAKTAQTQVAPTSLA